MLECLMSGSLFGWLAGNNTSGDGPSRQESRNLLNVRIIHVRTCGVSSEARPSAQFSSKGNLAPTMTPSIERRIIEATKPSRCSSPKETGTNHDTDRPFIFACSLCFCDS